MNKIFMTLLQKSLSGLFTTLENGTFIGFLNNCFFKKRLFVGTPFIGIVISALTILGIGNCKGANQITDLQGGVFTFIKGDVKLFDIMGKPKPIKVEGFFLPTDEIRTGKDSVADIQLMDGVIIRIKQNSIITLKKIWVDSGRKEMAANIELNKGALFAKVVSKLTKNSSFNVKTPTSVAGVRGTEFLVQDNGDKSDVLVNDGTVAVNAVDDDKHIGEEVVVEEGHKVTTNKDNNIKKSELTEEEKNSLKEDSQSVQSITEDARARIQDILKDFEENKARIKQHLEDQKESNRLELEGQKDKNRQELEDQKAKDKAELESVKGSTNIEKDALKTKGKSDMDEIKKDKGSLKDKLAPN
ncbi:MAG: FecR domain-containing protein [Leptospiraceae bacterium]|nr:FecR domain-containing protein [Leptospiraceae bacterium]